MARIPPSSEDVAKFYSDYPSEYAKCRTWKHGPEKPYAVNRPNGKLGNIEVTRICQCGRLVTRVYTASYERLTDKTRVIYPTEPRYLALPGMGEVDRAEMARVAIEGELAALEQEERAARERREAIRRAARPVVARNVRPIRRQGE